MPPNKTEQEANATPGHVASTDQLGLQPERDIASEALLHAGKCRTWATKTFNEAPDAALCVGAGDRLLYAAQLLDAQSLQIERLRTKLERRLRGECICVRCGLRQDGYDARAHADSYPGF